MIFPETTFCLKYGDKCNRMEENVCGRTWGMKDEDNRRLLELLTRKNEANERVMSSIRASIAMQARTVDFVNLQSMQATAAITAAYEKTINKSLELVFEKMKQITDISQIHHAHAPLLISLASDSMRRATRISGISELYKAVTSFMLAQIDTSMLDDIGEEFSDYEEVSQEEQEIVIEIVSDIFANADNPNYNINERFKNRVEKFKNKHYIAFIIISVILTSFILPQLNNKLTETTKNIGTTKNMTNIVRADPKLTSNTVDVLPQNANIIILEDAPYYFKIAYQVEEDNKMVEKEGYLSKRAIVFENMDNLKDLAEVE